MTLKTLEAKLDVLLNKDAPVNIPPNGRKMLAESLWILALIVGVFQLLLAYWLWEAGHRVDSLVDYANAVSSYYGGAPVAAQHLGPFFYLALLSTTAVAVMLLLASPSLKAMKKDGWNLVFYAVLVEVVVAFLLMFSRYRGFTDFLGALLAAVIGAFLLFQVRQYFTGRTAEASVHADKPKTKTTKADDE
ncbi:MAG TPA: hypothetical protein VLF43_01770 [Candidatus Saccharimonadales bacterium]|nr:hypothetical protein [Candidatus Saccharimonadales bacterium]